MLDADGAETLTFAQAQDRARAWFAELARSGGRVVRPITVGEAVAAYLANYEARGGKALRETRTTVNAHILPKLGKRKVADLTPTFIKTWHHDLANAPARLRTAANATSRRVRAAPADDDARRARQATANRVLTILKATLNFAWGEGRVASDDAWRRVKPFKNADTPRVRYLTDAEAQRLVNACPPDLRALATAGLLTGCRYQELTKLRPMDVNGDAGVLMIRTSKSGKPRAVVLTDEARRFFGQAMLGKAPRDLLLRRADGEVWGNRINADRSASRARPPASSPPRRSTSFGTRTPAGSPCAGCRWR